MEKWLIPLPYRSILSPLQKKKKKPQNLARYTHILFQYYRYGWRNGVRKFLPIIQGPSRIYSSFHTLLPHCTQRPSELLSKNAIFKRGFSNIFSRKILLRALLGGARKGWLRLFPKGPFTLITIHCYLLVL